ncbi:hypothetical protein H8957_016025, partial [Semnopithecus entellus]
MNSVAGNKERLAVSTRGKKYGVNDVCSPTKPAAPFSPESWYRKAYEESRAGSRPTPEGAGSALGSSGTPSPGSGTSSPSSFTGSPGPASPGIGTSSPGSLGGSPGFGTGSPGSGSGGGSSPGSDRGVWCENCNARLVELKRQALKLLLPGPFPGKKQKHTRKPAFPPCQSVCMTGEDPEAGSSSEQCSLLACSCAKHTGSSIATLPAVCDWPEPPEDSQGSEPEIGAKERIAQFWASLDHSDICDRTFEWTGQVLGNISPTKFPRKTLPEGSVLTCKEEFFSWPFQRPIGRAATPLLCFVLKKIANWLVSMEIPSLSPAPLVAPPGSLADVAFGILAPGNEGEQISSSDCACDVQI